MLGAAFFYSRSTLTLMFWLFVLIGCLVSPSNPCQKNGDCRNGYCMEGTCICNDGWWGNLCQFCRLRLSKESDVITDGHGQYAVSSKCSWLIESPWPNSTIHLDLKMFATECNWDHLYIYDGNSVRSPLIAVLSGIVKDPKRDVDQSLVLGAHSGSAFLYFYSDKLYKDKGFRIKYRIFPDCSVKCSFHGYCATDGKCICDAGWTGTNCNVQTCIAKCVNGFCSNATRLCVCDSGFFGTSCNVTGDKALWTQYSSKGLDLIQGRASHASAVVGDYMWVFGGFSFNVESSDNLVRYHIPSDSWEVVSHSVNSSAQPSSRYGHSMIAYNASLYVFGGRVNERATHELWSFDTQGLNWSLLPEKGTQGDSPVPVAGHTATLVGSKMIVLFGYGPQGNYTNKVQEYDLETGLWGVHDVQLKDNFIKPTFGHSSAYDPVTHLIYVHGGFLDETDVTTVTSLTCYDPVAKTWQSLRNSSVPRFLHTAVFLDGIMLVFGGNSHNGTSVSPTNLSCFSMDFVAYDPTCDEWKRLSLPKSIKSVGRYGHTAVVFNRTMFVYGGFQGVFLNDVLSFTPGPCALMKDKTACEMHSNSSDCTWNVATSTCLGPERCVKPQIKDEDECRELGQSCRRCLSGVHGCSWCESERKCVKGNCPNGQEKVDSSDKCSGKVDGSSTCQGTECENFGCFKRSECKDCVSTRSCMWCESQKQCVISNAYPVSFPYGQCRGWAQGMTCSDVRCSGRKTCHDCHTLPGCGWCDDGSGTGLGNCSEGGDDGPFANSSANDSSADDQCPSDRWYFVECPACQCNGHSMCINGNICEKCKHQTTGPHCEVCSPGYYGNAENGGTCKACECNKHAKSCHSKTGECICLAEYVIGRHCERCGFREGGTQYSIVGNATNGGHCYNNLSSNFHYTFNVSNKTSISFLNIPTEENVDVGIEVEIVTGQPALLNLSYSTNFSPVHALVSRHEVGRFARTIPHETFHFNGRFSFHVHVFDMKGFVTLRVTFVQKHEFMLLKFFIVFFACFFSLLFVVALAWKIKVRYSHYVMARHRVEEMKQMASRPFAKVCLAFTNPSFDTPYRQSASSAIAVQPMDNHNAAVGVFVMRLPGASDGFAPIGQTGICCATALGTRGNHGPQCHAVRTTRGTIVKRHNMVTSCCA